MSFRRLAFAILAAGSGSRFGEDKLAKTLGEFSVLEHVAKTIAKIDAPLKFCVISNDQSVHAAMLTRYAIQPIVNAAPDLGMSSSILLAVEAAEKAQADGLLIGLGDMPLVPAAHYSELIRKAERAQLACSLVGERRMPPALFPLQLFGELKRLSGDQGAREILYRYGDEICAPLAPEHCLDIDTQEDLSAAQKSLASGTK
ncbi:MAG: nucleotidyltransferase family protein [Parvularculaceae bacterium]